MKYKHQLFLVLSISAILVTMLILFNVNTELHDLIMQLLIVQVIIGVIFYPKFVLFSTVGISIFHFFHDMYYLSTFPLNAFIESAIQISILIVVLNVLKSRKLIKNRLVNIIEASRVGTWEWNIDTNAIIVNDLWAEIVGYTKEELSPLTLDAWKKLVHPDDFKKAEKMIQKVLSGDLPYYDTEIRIKQKNGSYLWVHDRGKITETDKAGKALSMSGTYINIDENKKVYEKVDYYHQLLSYVIDHMNSGIAVHDKDLNYVYVSKKYLDQYNIKEDIIGKHHYEVIPDLPEKWRKVHKRCLKGEVLSKDRDPYIHEDGSIDITRWECRPWYNEDGDIAGIIIYTELINDFIEIEEALKKSKETLQMVMDSLPIGIALHSLKPSFEIEYMNDMFPECYNTTRDALENNDFWETVYPDENIREIYKKEVFKAIGTNENEISKWVDVPLYENGQIIKYVTALIKPIQNSNQFISTVIDTTTRKHLEASLIEKADEMFVQKEQSEATLLAIGDGVISTNHLGEIIAFNDTASAITGYKKEEVVGKLFCEIVELIDAETGKDLACPVERVIETKKTIHSKNKTILISKDNQQKFIENSASPIKDQNGDLTGVILVVRDVTEVKQKQREIEFLSIHDSLTGLYNRRYFTEKLASLDKDEYYPLGILMIDVNGLKIINDAYGNQTGDLVLKEISNVLKEVVPKTGIVSRIGGDEFTIIMKNSHDEKLLKLKEKIIRRVEELTVKNVSLSVSIGFSLKEKDSNDISEVLRKAENFMYRFKIIETDSVKNQTIQAIHKTLTDKYDLERKHSERVSDLSRKIGEALEMERDTLRELEMSGLFHDIGKISIPDYILYKPGKLTEEEYNIIKEHTRNGYMILRAAGEYSDLAENALYHHEHFNGKGYPEGLSGEDIPLQARIICVADAYEAMTSDRPYRKAMDKDKAISELVKFKGTQFDPNIVDVFINKVLINEENI